jgi:hypothetical protein
LTSERTSIRAHVAAAKLVSGATSPLVEAGGREYAYGSSLLLRQLTIAEMPGGDRMNAMRSRAACWFGEFAATAAVKTMYDWIASGIGPTNWRTTTSVEKVRVFQRLE